MWIRQGIRTDVSEYGWHCYMVLSQPPTGGTQIIYDCSHAWTAVQNLYDWLKKKHISKTYKIRNRSDVNSVGKTLSKKSRCCAAIFFQNSGENINHAALNGEIFHSGKSYDIYYYVHSNNRNGKRHHNGKRTMDSIKDFYLIKHIKTALYMFAF